MIFTGICIIILIYAIYKYNKACDRSRELINYSEAITKRETDFQKSMNPPYIQFNPADYPKIDDNNEYGNIYDYTNESYIISLWIFFYIFIPFTILVFFIELLFLI